MLPPKRIWPGLFQFSSGQPPFNQCTPLVCEQLGALSRPSQGDPVNFPISPAFEYVEMAAAWFWPVVAILAALGIGYVAGRRA
jgi:hypothetical protein